MSLIAKLLQTEPIAFNPALVPIAGSVCAAVLLGKLLSRQSGDDWQVLPSTTITELTGLSRREIDSSIHKLKTAGLVECKLAGMPAIRHIRTDIHAVEAAYVAKYSGIPTSVVQLHQNAKQVAPIRQTVCTKTPNYAPPRVAPVHDAQGLLSLTKPSKPKNTLISSSPNLFVDDFFALPENDGNQLVFGDGEEGFGENEEQEAEPFPPVPPIPKKSKFGINANRSSAPVAPKFRPVDHYYAEFEKATGKRPNLGDKEVFALLSLYKRCKDADTYRRVIAGAFADEWVQGQSYVVKSFAGQQIDKWLIEPLRSVTNANIGRPGARSGTRNNEPSQNAGHIARMEAARNLGKRTATQPDKANGTREASAGPGDMPNTGETGRTNQVGLFDVPG